MRTEGYHLLPLRVGRTARRFLPLLQSQTWWRVATAMEESEGGGGGVARRSCGAVVLVLRGFMVPRRTSVRCVVRSNTVLVASIGGRRLQGLVDAVFLSVAIAGECVFLDAVMTINAGCAKFACGCLCGCRCQASQDVLPQAVFFQFRWPDPSSVPPAEQRSSLEHSLPQDVGDGDD